MGCEKMFHVTIAASILFPAVTAHSAHITATPVTAVPSNREGDHIVSSYPVDNVIDPKVLSS